MTFSFSDPLFLLSAQSGLTQSQKKDARADGGFNPEDRQRAVQLGEPVPLIFCRRRTVDGRDNGGVFVAPKATEGFFQNTSPYNELNFAFLLVLSEGELPLLQQRDIFQRTCREGDTFNQAYGARAGTWTADNQIDTGITGNIWRAPNIVGTGGSYENMTTLSYEANSVGSVYMFWWDRQIFAFVRQGVKVTRLLDSVVGPSDNFADLVNYLFSATAQVDSDFVDTTQLTIAANFVNANNLLFNGELSKSRNLLDWLEETSYNFLLRPTLVGGKIALRPRLPYNTDYTIKTTPITPEFTFTENHVLPNGFEIEYIPLEDRKPFCAVVLWRQQPESDFGFVRSIEVRYQGEAANGPFVQRDLSNYCTSEDHAIKVGVYSLAARKHITHHLRIKVRERSYNSTLSVGDIVRVRLRRETHEGKVTFHDYMYEIERIGKPPEAFMTFDLTHFPIDTQGQSVIAKAVASAKGQNRSIELGRGTFDCDIRTRYGTATVGTSSSSPSSPPANSDTQYDIQNDPNDWNPPNPSPQVPLPPTPPSPINNPSDPLEQPLSAEDNSLKLNGTLIDSQSFPQPADTLSVDESSAGCDNARVCWYRVDKTTGEESNIVCQTQAISGSFSLQITTADIGYYIVAKGQCPDPSSPDGFGPETQFGRTQAVEPDVSGYTFCRWQGYRYVEGARTTETILSGPWFTVPSGSFMTVGGINDSIQYLDSFANLTGTFGNGSDQPWRAIAYANKVLPLGQGDAARKWVGGEGVGNGVLPGDAPFPFGAQEIFNNSTVGAGTQLAAVAGKWQFSNDTTPTKTVELEWVGRNYIASGTTFASNDFSSDLPFNPNV